MARNYPFGTSLRMGPGYFPSVLGGMLVLFGLYLVAAGLRSNEKIEGNWSLRALIVLPLSLVHVRPADGIRGLRAGADRADRRLGRWRAASSSSSEVLLLAVGLTAFAVALFIYGLGLPYPLFMAW